MTRFRKRPAEVQALQFDGTNGDEIFDWVIALNGSTHPTMTWHGGEVDGHDEPATLKINAAEVTMVASVGDWIVRTEQGEFFPCKPDDFAVTYEAA